jgi:FMN phosphatase YigB (HAD superfamily)
VGRLAVVLTGLPDGFQAGEALYAGDRVDNDVIPAKRAGTKTAWILRGAGAYIVDAGGHGDRGADARLEGLADLPGGVAGRNQALGGG